VQRAYQYTGFEEIKSVPQTAAAEMASCMTLQEDNTPFLNDSVTGRTVWVTMLNDVRLTLPSWNQSWVETYNPKNFTAIVDSVTGRLFKIYSTSEVEDSNLAPEPPPDTAANMMKMMGEQYVGFPAQPPTVTFLEALDKACGSDPLRAKEILAVYVLYVNKFSDVAKQPRPVWCITGRGIEPLDFHTVDGPLYMRNRRRTVVDAMTGKVLWITNQPSVMHREQDKDPTGSSGGVPADSVKR
jgi:hypothetical protein